MAKTLQDFMTTIQEKGVRTQNLFQLEIISQYNDVDGVLEDITIWADNAEVPGRTQDFAEIAYQGYPFQVPTQMTMTNEHSFTIRCDAKGDIRKAFLKWMNYVSNSKLGEGSMLEGEKKLRTESSIRMYLMDHDMSTVLETYRLIGVLPMEVGGIEMTNSAQDIATFDVTLKSQYWELVENAGAFSDLS